MPDSAIKFTPVEVSRYYAARVPALQQRRMAEWRGWCPIHDGEGDNFAVNATTGEAYCHSVCGRGWDIIALEQAITGADFKAAKTEVFRLVGRLELLNGHHKDGIFSDGAKTEPTKPSKPSGPEREIARYQYVTRGGNLLFEVVRYVKGDGGKAFKQCRPDGRGGVIWNLDGIERVPYRLPKLLNAGTVYLPEGEKDVHTLESWQLTASCNPGGSGSSHLYAGWADYFRSRHIIILPDNDEPGRKHAAAVAEALVRVAASVRIVELPGLPAKGDITDWRATGGTLDQLHELIEASDPMDPAALSELRARWGLGDQKPDHPGRTEATDDWPEPEPIKGELPPVQAFSEDLLPDSLRPLVADVTERMQVPVDYPAVVMVLCLAGAVNRRAVIQPKANDTGWAIVPNLWGGIIAPPGFMKSPVIHATTRPLNQIQTEWRREHEQTLREYALAVEEWELRKSAWKQLSTAQYKKGNSAPERPPEPPSEPILRRLIVNDATFEAMHETMSENPAGIFVIRDELTGWWSTLDRAGREGERAFCLQAWNGDTGHTIDRIGRGTIHVPACCMSMLGGIQPGRLRSYLVDAIKDGPGNDGLIQRFQLLVWPDTVPEWRYVDRPPNPAAEQQAAHLFRKLVEIDADNPARFRFAPDAQELFIEWLADLETKIRGDELYPAFASHLSKYRSLMPSLALLFELADRASSDGFDGSQLLPSRNLIRLEHARRAAAWCEYLESHARRVYSCLVTPQLRAARKLAEHIRKKHIRNKDGSLAWFAARDVYLKGWTGLDTPEAVKAAIEVLEDARWVRESTVGPRATGGRPSNRYSVNPRIWG